MKVNITNGLGSAKNAAIVVAGGLGRRMNSVLPKQFMPLHGKPVFLWSLECFNKSEDVSKIVLVLPEDWIDTAKQYLAHFTPSKEFVIAVGGAQRQDSVWNGLEALGEGYAFVAVHDAARPGITTRLVRNGFEKAIEKGNAVFAVPTYDTLAKIVNGAIAANVNRAETYRIQTPQIFNVKILKEAMNYAKANNIVCTDEASIVREFGERVFVTEGSERLTKITTAEDIKTVEFLMDKGGLDE